MGVSHSSSQTASSPTAHLLPPVETLNIEDSTDRRDRALKHLLRLNHHSHAVLYHDLIYHNHLPHFLASAHLLGANDTLLTALYDKGSAELEPWTHSPNEIDESDWRCYLGDSRYQRAYLDFFEDEMVREKYDWKKVLRRYLLEEGNQAPLVNGLICGLGHPLIHLGYAIELNNREVAMEALAMAASCYSDLHTFIDKAPDPLPPTATKSILELLERIANDDRLTGLCPSGPGEENIDQLLSLPYSQIVQEYLNQLDMSDSITLLHQLSKIPTLLLCATHSPASPPKFDFFLVHTLTTSYSLRVLLPFLPPPHHLNLFRQHLLLIIILYISQKRPKLRPELITNYQLEQGKDTWEFVTRTAIDEKNEWIFDPHYVKALRAMRDFAGLYGDEEGFYLRAAVKFAREFRGWVGFRDSGDVLDVRD